MDSEDLEERDEERQKIKRAFEKISETENGKSYVVSDQFSKLIESLGSVYCEEEHKKTLEGNDRIYESDFLASYIDWLFGDSDGDDDDDDTSEDSSDIVVGNVNENEENSESLGSFFKVDEASWKCDVCSVCNKENLNTCVACYNVRPDFEAEATTGSGGVEAAPASSSSIGADGFCFGGAPAKAVPETSSLIGAGGFSYGGATGATPFGAKPAVKAPVSSSSAAYPPMSSKEPTPFGAEPATKAPNK